MNVDLFVSATFGHVLINGGNFLADSNIINDSLSKCLLVDDGVRKVRSLIQTLCVTKLDAVSRVTTAIIIWTKILFRTF